MSPIWCNVSPSPTDMSPTENSWMLHPLDKMSLGYCAPDRTIPSLNTDWMRHPCHVRSMRCALHAWRGPGLGHIGQGHNIQGTLCSRGATSKNFWSGTHRSGTHQPWTPYILYIYSQKWKV